MPGVVITRVEQLIRKDNQHNMLAFTDKNSDNLINEPVLNEDEDDLIYETEDLLSKAYMAGVCLVKI